MLSSTNEKKLGNPMSPVTTREEGIVEHVHLGYNAQITKNRSLISVLGMCLAIVAVPYGIGGPL